jgi:hypothetical protein
VLLASTDWPFIHELAAAIRRATLFPKKRIPYRVYACEWLFPRATKVLDDFAMVLKGFCNSQPQADTADNGATKPARNGNQV